MRFKVNDIVYRKCINDKVIEGKIMSVCRNTDGHEIGYEIEHEGKNGKSIGFVHECMLYKTKEEFYTELIERYEKEMYHIKLKIKKARANIDKANKK